MNANLEDPANGNSALTDTAALVGRILLALIFILSGYGKLAGFRGTVAYMTSNGLPFSEVLAKQQMIHLEKNLSIMGGLLVLFAFGAGKFGMEQK